MFKNKTYAGLLAGATMLTTAAAISPANATTTFDDSLGTPGFYNGSGNPDGGFTINTLGNGAQLGMRIKNRFDANVIDSPTNVYTVHRGAGSPGRAKWNYEFSTDLCPGGTAACGLTLADFHYSLTVTDLATGKTNTVDPSIYWGDNAQFGVGGEHDGLDRTGADWSFQNSENIGFGDFPLASLEPTDFNALRDYQFDLSLLDLQDNVLGTDTVIAHVVPEPATLALLGGPLLGLGLMRRRGKLPIADKAAA